MLCTSKVSGHVLLGHGLHRPSWQVDRVEASSIRERPALQPEDLGRKPIPASLLLTHRHCACAVRGVFLLLLHPISVTSGPLLMPSLPPEHAPPPTEPHPGPSFLGVVAPAEVHHGTTGKGGVVPLPPPRWSTVGSVRSDPSYVSVWGRAGETVCPRVKPP